MMCTRREGGGAARWLACGVLRAFLSVLLLSQLLGCACISVRFINLPSRWSPCLGFRV